MAAILGLVQKFGRFRITVKKDMCISCGNCSTYCEMGIDVRQYAMANEDVRRAACVGCGMCAHMCPRGVLKLENKPIRWKAGQPIRVYAVDL
jgi:Pyruvate/2-oxoacid:ferredoxin oxidoreductase delta subunit